MSAVSHSATTWISNTLITVMNVSYCGCDNMLIEGLAHTHRSGVTSDTYYFHIKLLLPSEEVEA